MPSTHYPRYLLRWDHSRGLEVGRDIVVTGHRIGELPMVADQCLADLIDQHPREAISVHTMGTNPAYRNESQAGRLGHITGQQLIDAVEHGRLCVVLKNVATYHDEFHDVTSRLGREIVDCHVGIRIHNPNAHLVFASPGAIQYYRCDGRPNIRWQLRGQQTVITYPSTDQFVHPMSYEDALVSGNCDRLYYEPAFEAHAESIHIESAQMISLPPRTPYRVECGDGLNVWLETHYDDQATIRRRSICLANRTLRKLLPPTWCEDQTTGVWASAKNLFAKFAKLDARRPTTCTDHQTGFVVEASTRSQAAYPTAPVHDLVPATTTSVVLEN